MKVAQSCPTLCNPMDYRVHGILQARILEWVAFPFSRGSSKPRQWTQVSRTAGGFLTSWANREAQQWLVVKNLKGLKRNLKLLNNKQVCWKEFCPSSWTIQERKEPLSQSRCLQLPTSTQPRSLGLAAEREESLKSPQGYEQSLRFTDTELESSLKFVQTHDLQTCHWSTNN